MKNSSLTGGGCGAGSSSEGKTLMNKRSQREKKERKKEKVAISCPVGSMLEEEWAPLWEEEEAAEEVGGHV